MTSDELREEIAERREGIGRDLTAIGDRVSPGRMADRSKERARRNVASWRTRVMGSADHVKTSIGGAASSATGSAGSGVGQRISDTEDMVTERVEGSPIAVGLVAFGLGFIAGSLLPATRQEQRLAEKVEPQLDQLAQTVGSTARQAADKVAPTVSEELDAAKGEAKDAVSSAKESAKDELQSAREDVAPSS